MKYSCGATRQHAHLTQQRGPWNLRCQRLHCSPLQVCRSCVKADVVHAARHVRGRGYYLEQIKDAVAEANNKHAGGLVEVNGGDLSTALVE